MKNDNLDNMDFKALRFRNDLIKLLSEYNAELGVGLDGDGLTLNLFSDNDNEPNRFYDISCTNELKYTDGYCDPPKFYNIDKEYEKHVKNLLVNDNNSDDKLVLIFSDNKVKVNRLFNKILKKNKGIPYVKHDFNILYNDGTKFMWIVANENIKASLKNVFYRCFIDKDLDIEIINSIAEYSRCKDENIILF